MPTEFLAQVAARYIEAYERLVGRPLVPSTLPAAPRIDQVLGTYAG